MSELELLSASKTQDRAQHRVLDQLPDKTPHKKIVQILPGNSSNAQPARNKMTPIPSKQLIDSKEETCPTTIKKEAHQDTLSYSGDGQSTGIKDRKYEKQQTQSNHKD